MIKEFLRHQAINKGLAAQTIEGYRKDLSTFVSWAGAKGLTWSTITAHDMDDYVRSQVELQMQPRTIKKRVEVVRLIYTFACHQRLLDYNPAQYTQCPKITDTLPKAADRDRIEAYLQTESTSRQSYITHAAVAIMFDTGIRIGELLSIKGEDINTAKRCIAVHGKGSNERIVPYSDISSEYLRAMSFKRGICLELTAIDLRYMIIRELPGVNPHSLRHAFACKQLAAGMPLKSLSVILGHKNIKTTEIYAKATSEVVERDYRLYN